MQVPVVEVQDVDIRSPQLLETGLNAKLEVLQIITDVVHALLQRLVSWTEVVGVLRRSANEPCSSD